MHSGRFERYGLSLLVRPVVGANHANWQLGHLVRAETGILSSIGAKMPELPAAFMDKYEQKKANVDGAENFVSKEELLSRFEAARNAAIEFARNASEEFMKQEAPEKMRRMCATNGDMLGLILGHTTMHIGQIQVLRRKLGKPILFYFFGDGAPVWTASLRDGRRLSLAFPRKVIVAAFWGRSLGRWACGGRSRRRGW